VELEAAERAVRERAVRERAAPQRAVPEPPVASAARPLVEPVVRQAWPALRERAAAGPERAELAA
jgi:hypothetical protein